MLKPSKTYSTFTNINFHQSLNLPKHVLRAVHEASPTGRCDTSAASRAITGEGQQKGAEPGVAHWVRPVVVFGGRI